MASDYSILSSAEAYVRKANMKIKREPLGIGEVVKVKLDLRFLSGTVTHMVLSRMGRTSSDNIGHFRTPFRTCFRT